MVHFCSADPNHLDRGAERCRLSSRHFRNDIGRGFVMFFHGVFGFRNMDQMLWTSRCFIPGSCVIPMDASGWVRPARLTDRYYDYCCPPVRPRRDPRDERRLWTTSQLFYSFPSVAGPPTFTFHIS